jgi:hypothetical protein
MSTGVSVSRSNQVEWVESVIHDCVILDSNLHWITDWLMFILGETIRLIGSFLSELWLNKRLRPTFAAITLYPWSFLKSSRCADIICAGPSFLCLSVRVCVNAGPCLCMHVKQCSHFYHFYYIKLTQSHKHWQIRARTNTRCVKGFCEGNTTGAARKHLQLWREVFLRACQPSGKRQSLIRLN